MNSGPSPPRQTHSVVTEGSGTAPTKSQLNDTRDQPESSEDDVPLRNRRPSAPVRNFCDVIHIGDDDDDLPRLRGRRAPRQEYGSFPDTTPPVKQRKKPGPKPWAVKPITKNDMAAKKEVIREIEKYWGKGFIKNYIPKCHRPLVKRPKGAKRSSFRNHESDPKNWMPSVLKSILMIAKLTNDKEWLRKTMEDVVRYRIKNTGNRKPQLVTTDFDVLEDMLEKGWDVVTSFNIRYKYLLQNNAGFAKETDENIDHILYGGLENDENSDHEIEDDDEEEDDVGADQMLSTAHQQTSSYISTPSKKSSASRNQSKTPRPGKQMKREPSQTPGPASVPPHPNMYGYGAHPSNLFPYGQQMPGYGGYGGFNPFGPYSGYGGYGNHPGDQYPHQPNRRGGPGSPEPPGQHGPHGIGPPGMPPFQMGYFPPGFPPTPSPGFNHPEGRQNMPPGPYGGDQRIKREDENLDGPSNDAKGEDDDDDLEAQMQAAEAEAKLARLRAEYARRKNKGGNSRNPMSLE